MTEEKAVVMIVEDEDLLLQAISRKLQLSGINSISCITGAQAVDYLNNLERLPDAIWLDYHLKDMDGLTFMHILKRHKKWENIPVIVISNSAGQDKVNNLLALGVKKYMVKAEHRLDDIITTVKQFIIDNKT